MKKILCIIISLILLAPAAVEKIPAQDFIFTPVQISKEIVKIRGNLFYAHKVLEKQTLHSISKAYNVSIYDIRQCNPYLNEDGLKTGMILYIPLKPTLTAKQESASDTKEKLRNDNDTTDTVENIFKTIKKTSVKDKPSDTKKKYRKHTVRWYESIEDIAVKYNVTAEAICKLNNIENRPGKRIRLKFLLIPDEEYLRKTNKESVKTASEEEHMSRHEDIYVRKKEDFTGRFEIALILPLNASRNTDGLQPSIADFYSGVLIAVKDLKEKGQFDNITLKTIDLYKYDSTREMLSSGILENSSLIIGPFTERQLQPVSYYAKNHKIPIVSPLDINTKDLALENPYYFLFPPNPELSLGRQIDKIANEIRNDEEAEVLVLYETGYEYSDLMNRTITGFENKGVEYRKFNYDILSGIDINKSLVRFLNPSKPNIVLIPSEKEAFVNDALRNLYLIKSSKNYQIEVYGINKWKNSETIDINYCHDLNLSLAVSYYIDYNLPKSMKFINDYREIFHAEPSPFSYQGYDVLTYFTNALNNYGRSFPHWIINKRDKLIQTDVLFVPVADNSGYENCALRDIRYINGWIITQD